MNPTSNSLSNRKILQGEYTVSSRKLFYNLMIECTTGKFCQKLMPEVTLGEIYRLEVTRHGILKNY